MYKLKDEMKDKIRAVTNRSIANKVGVTEGYISLIVNDHKPNITKTLAYAISKAISNDYEIEDVFEIL
jgi:plasmid maintenance system antidote protein VapI